MPSQINAVNSLELKVIGGLLNSITSALLETVCVFCNTKPILKIFSPLLAHPYLIIAQSPPLVNYLLPILSELRSTP